MSIYHQTDLVTLYQGDCLQVMPDLEARSFDAIICDLPYGTTACKWDSVIPFEPLWEQYKRLIKPNGAIVLFGSQPFTTDLIMSNRAWFRYEDIWEKSKPIGFLHANCRPLRSHENILVFCSGQVKTFNPQKYNADPETIDRRKTFTILSDSSDIYGKLKPKSRLKDDGTRYPKSIIKFASHHSEGGHPTQKPIALLEYLIRTYTNEGDTILDNTAGSGTALVAARNTNRRAVGIEMDEGYCRVAAGRLGRFEPSEFEMDKKAVEGQLGLFGAIACL